MKLTVSLPMYDFPEVRGALGVVWRHVALRLEQVGVEGVPAALEHDRGLHDLWADPTLLLSQCCGYDIINRYADKLVPLATPLYTSPGCQGCNYSSVVLVAENSQATDLEHLRDSACVVNGLESHSGANALRALVAPLSRNGRFFASVQVSGTHLDSVAALTNGQADVTAIDCVTYALLERYRPLVLARTRQLCYTPRAPGIPYVTRAGTEEKLTMRLQRALVEAFEDAEVQAACEAIFIDGIVVLPPSTYKRIAELEQFAVAQGYPELR